MMQQGLFTRRQESHPKRRSALARRQARPRLYVELLEDRSLLSGSPYLPPSHMLSNPNGLLTGPTQGDPLDIAVNYLGTNASAFGLAPADLREAIVTDRYTDADTGITHIYLRQSFNGLEVANANIGVHLNAQGQVISAGGGFVSGLSNQGWGGTPLQPALSALDAVKAASANLNLNPEAAPLPEPQIVSASYDPAQTTVIAAPGVSLDDVTARLHYVPTPDGGVALAWDLVIRTPDGDHWYNLSIDGSCGATVAQTDWVSHASYSAIPLPNESPQDGGFAVISGIEDATASPFGWHDTNGAAGAEFTDTRGNNVDAHLDRDGNNVADASPPRPNGGVALDFSGFTFNPAGAPSTLQNENAAVVNLFVMNNVLHDIHYKYGFTEAAGNFQTNNYGRGGSGSDAVQADAQDNANGGSTNNANFSTPPDGFAPRMQMYEFTLTTPRRDSDLDNGVIIHEYAHGVSNRLTGGPANSNALNALQSGGMGEGWGDFYGLMFAQRSTDLQNDAFGMGTYVLGQPQTGLGIRRYRYSYNMTIDPLTFAYFNGGYPNNEVHNSGEIWASTLWDLNWLLINKYGFDSDLYTGWTAAPGPGHAGNKLALRLVMEAMKLQPANPSFIQARDAIIAADVALNGGADLLEIWTAFARRGLGLSAFTANSSSTVVTVAFDLPNLGLTVTGTTPASGAIVTTPPTTFVVDFSDPYDSASVQPGDLTVNGIPATGRTFTDLDTVTFTYGISPVTSQGLQTMTIAAGAITRDSDNDGVDAFSASFRYDALPLAVVSTSPPVGATVTLPLATLDVNLNEPVAPGSVSATDLTVNQGSVSGFTLLNSNTTIRFTLSGITTEGTLNASIAAGALTDTFGNPNVAFAGSYTLDFGTVAYPVPLIAKAPLGSLVYDPSITGVIAPAGDTDSFTLAIDPNQVISVTVTPAAGSGLQPTVVLLDPAGNVRAANAAAGPGKSVILQTVPTVGTTTGTYTVRVGGVGGTVGGFTLQVILNALAEAENHDGASNTTFTTAENINGSFISLGGAASRGAVLGRTGPETGGAASLVQDFESGAGGFTINNNTIGTGVYAGLWHLSTRRGSQTGHSPVTSFYYGSETGGTYDTGARNGGSITSPVISLPAGASQLSFNYVLQTEGNGPFDLAQVQISTNNFATFTTLLTSAASLPLSSTWRAATASLAAFAGQNVQIRWIFDTIDSSFNGYEGWYVDDVAIQPPPPSPADYYAFTLAAGDTATVALEALPAGTLSLTLLDPSGAAVALGAGGPTNVDRVIQNFRATTSGLYRALVTASTTVDYNLVVTRNADFDTEANDSLATAQPLQSRSVGGAQYALGHVAGGASGSLFDLTGPTVTGAVVLSGSKITLGFNPDGSFVTAVGGIGIQYNGTEFVVPGSPLASFTVSYNGLTFTNNAANGVSQIAGITRQDLSLGTRRGLRIVGTAGGILQVERIVVFNQNDDFVTIATRLTNLSGSALTNVATLENVDPDPDSTTGNFTTRNDVVLGGELVWGAGPTSGLTVGLGSSDLRSVVSAEGFDNRNPFLIIDTPVDPNGTVGDIAIAQAFDFGGLAAGVRVSGIALMVFGSTTATAESVFVANSGGTPLANDDWYSIAVNAGDNLTVQSSTPADGIGEFVNTLNPKIELYAPSGVLVAAGTVLGDLRNEHILHTATTTGLYRVRVLSEGGTIGEYVLRVTGNTGTTAPPFAVTSTNPADGAVLLVAPTQLTVNFNDAILLSSLQAADLRVDGVPAIGVSIAVGDGDTATFTLAGPIGQGAHTVTIALGAILDVQGTPIQAYTGSFFVDGIAPRVTATSLAPNAVVSPGSLSYQIAFSEPMKTSNLTSDDFSLRGNLRAVNYSASSFSFNPAGTVLTLNYVGLPDDNYTLTLFSGATAGTNFTDVVGNALDGEFTGTFPSGNGIAGGNFLIGFSMDLATEAYPTPLTPKLPLGSLIYDPTLTRVLAFSGDVDGFTLAVDPGQTITVLVTPVSAGLRPVVEVRDPSNVSLGAQTAPATGKDALLNTVRADTGGTYRVNVSNAGPATGLYTVQVILNAALETEAHDGAGNDSRAAAQDLTPSLLTLQTDLAQAQRGAVLGRLGTSVIAGENFETGVLPASITTASFTQAGAPDPLGRIRVKTPDGTGNGSAFALMMDRNPSGANTLNEAIWTVDLTGVTTATLSFSHIQLTDEGNTLPLDFTGHFNGDGVAISANGVNWRTILSAPTNATWANFSVDLAAAAAAAGMTLGPNFKIKFQQYDNFPIGSGDGRGYDNLLITGADEDWYRVDLKGAERATVALKSLTAGTVNVALADSSGVILANGIAGATNLDRVISNFPAPVTGTYYLRVTGSANTDYSLVVTRSAAFDTEGNDTFATAQDVTGTQGVLGHSGGAGATVVTLNATDSGWYDSNGTHTATNTNYIVGQSGAPRQLRNFFVFNLASVSQVITGATLVLTNGISSRGPGYNSPDASETYTLFDVATSVPTLQAGGSGLTGIFADLGGGTIQGSRTMTAADNFLNVPITLNAAGIAKLNAFRGTQVALGGAVTTLSGGADQVVFAFTGNLTDVKQLILNLAQPEDWYKVTLASDQTALRLDTKTPADGAGQFVNTLNPTIELYNAAGTLVFSGTPGADGRNESLMATGLTAGSTYRIRVRSEGGTQGEYFLGVTPLATPTPTALVDNRNFGFRAYGPGWSLVPSGYAGDSRSHAGGGTGSSYAEWRYGQVFTAGTPYQFYVTWVHDPANASNATYRVMENAAVLHPGISVDQRVSPNSALYNGTLWQALYTYTPTTTGYKVIRIQLSDNANGPVSADAIFDPPLGPQGDVGVASLVAGPAASMPSFTVRGGAPILTPVTPFPGSSQGVVALPDRISVGLTAWAAPSAAFAASSVFADLAAPGRSASLFAENPAIEPASDGVPLRTWLDRAALTPPLSIFGASSFGDRWGDERHTASDSLAGDEVLDAEFVDDYFTAVARTDREESSADDAVLSGALVGDAYFPQALDEPLE